MVVFSLKLLKTFRPDFFWTHRPFLESTLMQMLIAPLMYVRDYHQDLRDMSEEDIRLELASQGVMKVSRFILKKDGKEIKTNTLFLTFDNHVPPEKLKIGYVVTVQPYIPNPLRCFKCFDALGIRRNGVRTSLPVGNVAAKAMTAASAPRRQLPVLTAKATTALHPNHAPS